MANVFETRAKSFMKLPCEQIYLEREKYIVSLRKCKRQELKLNHRKTYGGTKTIEISVIIGKVLSKLKEEAVIGNSNNQQGVRVLDDQSNLIPSILEFLSESVTNKELYLEPVFLEFFAKLSEKEEWCKLIVDKGILENLCDSIGFDKKDEEVLKIVTEVCEKCPQAAESLVEAGLFEQIEMVFEDDEELAEICSYALYRIILFSCKNLPDATLSVAARLCKRLLQYPRTKLWVYHCIYVISQKKDCENLTAFIFQDLLEDLKNKKKPALLLKIVINLTAGPDSILKELIKLDLLTILYNFLATPDFQIQKYILHILANLAGSDSWIVTCFICHNIFRKFIGFIDSFNYDLRLEASLILKNLGIQASNIIFSYICKKEIFCAIYKVLGNSIEIDKNLLFFFQNLFCCDNYYPGIRELAVESGCKDKIERICFKGGLIGLQAEGVLNNFDEYENMII